MKPVFTNKGASDNYQWELVCNPCRLVDICSQELLDLIFSSAHYSTVTSIRRPKNHINRVEILLNGITYYFENPASFYEGVLPNISISDADSIKVTWLLGL